MNNRRKIYKICVSILIILASLFICINAYCIADKIINKRTTITYFGIKPFVSEIDSPQTDIYIGDLIFAKDIPITDVNTGDVIVYKQDNSYLKVKKVLDIEKDNNKTNFIIDKETKTAVNEENSVIEGKLIKKIDRIGYLILFLKTLEGTLLAIALLICIAVIILLLCFEKKDDPNSIEKNGSSN